MEVGNIYNAIAISNFLNPTDEMEIEDRDEKTMDEEEILQ
jgi:hypothetical protein